MNILFVSRGLNNQPKIIVYNQAKSLLNRGVNIEFFLIKETGFLGYLKAVLSLRNRVKKGNIDVIHAHYSYSAFVSSLAGAKPLVVSLMGSDIKGSKSGRLLIRLFRYLFSWSSVITKSADLRNSINIKSEVVPNGVDFDQFKRLDKKECQAKLGWNTLLKHIVFAADPQRPEKNVQLARASFELIDLKEFEVHYLNNVPNGEMVFWYNAADIVLLTSLWEGSPNVIKEAMACCRPIVTTDVGDVRTIIGNTPYCFITTFDKEEIANRINTILSLPSNNFTTKGRERLSEIGFDSVSISSKLIRIYSNASTSK